MSGDGATARQLELQWNKWLVVASIAVSLLGAFTSTQLMCQATASRHFTGVLLWTMLCSLTFGFCSIWSLHEVAMLAYEPDLPIGINVPLTIVSSILAVFFTFAALASDVLWDRYTGKGHKKKAPRKKKRTPVDTPDLPTPGAGGEESDQLLSGQSVIDVGETDDRHDPEMGHTFRPDDDDSVDDSVDDHDRAQSHLFKSPNADTSPLLSEHNAIQKSSAGRSNGILPPSEAPPRPSITAESRSGTEASSSQHDTATDETDSRNSSSYNDSSSSSFGLGNIMSIKPYKGSPLQAMNAFMATGMVLYEGFRPRNIIKGLLWSIAITSMHYVGIAGLEIPEGYFVLNPWLVILSGLISWTICTIGSISMTQMETHLGQQFLFSIIATAGVAGMHFTGMRAATFYSFAAPSDRRGYPPALAIAIACIAISTCLAANALLAHSATVSRNKLAEIVYTRRKLWMAIAQKENAESAAAARSEFIASASHEIRTPLHHLQGYSDLLSRTELTEEGRLLLYSIQRATKTLSLITNNVLDWSRLERGGETACRPVALDIRTVCESIITLLPNEEEDVEVELMVVVSPSVPHALFLDETYIHRILMNLLSNAIKFTFSGYILLLIEVQGETLVATVKDTGIGVPLAFLPQLFEPFKQAQTRGTSRGTGLGLSIIKQLLEKMNGTIEVESKHQETDDIPPEECGSTFTIRVPVQKSPNPQDLDLSSRSRIAVFHTGNDRALEGIRTAWEKFDFDVLIAHSFSDLENSELEYVWANMNFLKQNPDIMQQLIDQDKWIVLVPCDLQTGFKDFPRLVSSPNFIPIGRPIIWHTMKKIIATARQPRPRIVRFASKVNVLDGIDDVKLDAIRSEVEDKPKSPVVLLVEDNPINRKLGIKMLSTLGYQVIIAEDGVEAIEQIIRHDDIIDAILMDQSMPRKDGIAATREIREMEASGKLSRRRPIIAVTAVVSAQSQTLCKLAGTDDFLPKPLSMSKLEQSLATHLKVGAKV